MPILEGPMIAIGRGDRGDTRSAIDDMHLLTTRPRPRLRRRLLFGIEKAFYWSGAGAVYVRARKVQGAVILMYHSVSRAPERRFLAPESTMPVELFEEQMRFIAGHRRVVSMDEVAQAAGEGRVFPAGTVALSFDDGYRDVLEVAAPILAHHGLPATLYLATGYVERAENQWVDELYTCFVHRTKNALFLDQPRFSSHGLAETEEVERVFADVARALLCATYDERRRLLDDVAAQLAPGERPPRLTLTFSEVRQLVREFPRFSIGVHTRNHVDLVGMIPEAVSAELDACVGDMLRELQLRPRHFSYPYGRHSKTAAAKLIELGFVSACATEPARVIDGGVNRFALPRFEAPAEMTLLRLRTSGAPERMGYFGLRRRTLPTVGTPLSGSPLQSGPRAAPPVHRPEEPAPLPDDVEVA